MGSMPWPSKLTECMTGSRAERPSTLGASEWVSQFPTEYRTREPNVSLSRQGSTLYVLALFTKTQTQP